MGARRKTAALLCNRPAMDRHPVQHRLPSSPTIEISGSKCVKQWNAFFGPRETDPDLGLFWVR